MVFRYVPYKKSPHPQWRRTLTRAINVQDGKKTRKKQRRLLKAGRREIHPRKTETPRCVLGTRGMMNIKAGQAVRVDSTLSVLSPGPWKRDQINTFYARSEALGWWFFSPLFVGVVRGVGVATLSLSTDLLFPRAAVIRNIIKLSTLLSLSGTFFKNIHPLTPPPGVPTSLEDSTSSFFVSFTLSSYFWYIFLQSPLSVAFRMSSLPSLPR